MKFKKFGKKTTVLGAILVCVGLLIAFGGFVGMGFRLDAFQWPKTPESSPESFTFTGDEVTSVDLSAGHYKILVEGAKDIKVPELTISQDLFQYEINNGKLTVQETAQTITGWRWYAIFNINTMGGEYAAVLRLPEDFSGSVRAKNSFEDVEISNFSGLEELWAKSDSSHVKITEVTVKDTLEAGSDFDRIEVRDCKAGQLKLRNDSGNSELENLQVKEASLSSSFGNISIKDGEFEELTVRNDSDNVYLEDVNVKGQLDWKGNFGSLSLEKVFSASYKLDSGSGDIRGNLLGSKDDYQVSMNVKFGNAPFESKSDGKYLLDVKNQFGNVDLAFLDDLKK